ncbi:hypothetical protein SAURM35S_02410 [Streptomyces aurantiogriseus]
MGVCVPYAVGVLRYVVRGGSGAGMCRTRRERCGDVPYEVGVYAGENRWSLIRRAAPITPAVGPNSPRTMGRLPVARGSDWR